MIEEDDLSAVPFDPAAWLTLSLAWQPQGYLSRAERAFIDYALSQRDSL